MQFVIGDDKAEVVKLTLTVENGMACLRANSMALIGLKNGKYRLFCDACNEPGLVIKNGLIVQDQTL